MAVHIVVAIHDAVQGRAVSGEADLVVQAAPSISRLVIVSPIEPRNIDIHNMLAGRQVKFNNAFTTNNLVIPAAIGTVNFYIKSQIVFIVNHGDIGHINGQLAVGLERNLRPYIVVITDAALFQDLHANDGIDQNAVIVEGALGAGGDGFVTVGVGDVVSTGGQGAVGLDVDPVAVDLDQTGAVGLSTVNIVEPLAILEVQALLTGLFLGDHQEAVGIEGVDTLLDTQLVGADVVLSIHDQLAVGIDVDEVLANLSQAVAQHQACILVVTQDAVHIGDALVHTHRAVSAEGVQAANDETSVGSGVATHIVVAALHHHVAAIVHIADEVVVIAVDLNQTVVPHQVAVDSVAVAHQTGITGQELTVLIEQEQTGGGIQEQDALVVGIDHVLHVGGVGNAIDGSSGIGNAGQTLGTNAGFGVQVIPAAVDLGPASLLDLVQGLIDPAIDIAILVPAGESKVAHDLQILSGHGVAINDGVRVDVHPAGEHKLTDLILDIHRNRTANQILDVVINIDATGNVGAQQYRTIHSVDSQGVGTHSFTDTNAIDVAMSFSVGVAAAILTDHLMLPGACDVRPTLGVAVAQGLALGITTDRAGLGSGTGGIVPVVVALPDSNKVGVLVSFEVEFLFRKGVDVTLFILEADQDVAFPNKSGSNTHKIEIAKDRNNHIKGILTVRVAKSIEHCLILLRDGTAIQADFRTPTGIQHYPIPVVCNFRSLFLGNGQLIGASFDHRVLTKNNHRVARTGDIGQIRREVRIGLNVHTETTVGRNKCITENTIIAANRHLDHTASTAASVFVSTMVHIGVNHFKTGRAAHIMGLAILVAFQQGETHVIFHLLVLSNVGHVAGDSHQLLVPTGEGVGGAAVGCLIGAALEGRSSAVLIGLHSGNAIYDPSNRVDILGPGSVGHDILSNGHAVDDLVAVLSVPAGKLIAGGSSRNFHSSNTQGVAVGSHRLLPQLGTVVELNAHPLGPTTFLTDMVHVVMSIVVGVAPAVSTPDLVNIIVDLHILPALAVAMAQRRNGLVLFAVHLTADVTIGDDNLLAVLTARLGQDILPNLAGDAVRQLRATAGIITVMIIIIVAIAQLLTALSVITVVILVSIHAGGHDSLTAGIITAVILVSILTIAQDSLTTSKVALMVHVGIHAGRQNSVTANEIALVILIVILTVGELLAALGVITVVVIVFVIAGADLFAAAGEVTVVILIAIHAKGQARTAAGEVTVVIFVSIYAAGQLSTAAGEVTVVIFVGIRAAGQLLAAGTEITVVILVSIYAVRHPLVTAAEITVVIIIGVHTVRQLFVAAAVITVVIGVAILTAGQLIATAAEVTVVILIVVLAVRQLVFTAGVITVVVIVAIYAGRQGGHTTREIALVVLIVIFAVRQLSITTGVITVVVMISVSTLAHLVAAAFGIANVIQIYIHAAADLLAAAAEVTVVITVSINTIGHLIFAAAEVTVVIFITILALGQLFAAAGEVTVVIFVVVITVGQLFVAAGEITVVIVVSIDTAAQKLIAADIITTVVIIGILTAGHHVTAAIVITVVIVVAIRTAGQLRMAAIVITVVIHRVVHAVGQLIAAAAEVTVVIFIVVLAVRQLAAAAGIITVVVLVGILAVGQTLTAAAEVTDMILIGIHTVAGTIATTVAEMIFVIVTHMCLAFSEHSKVSSLTGNDRQLSQNLTIGSGGPADKGIGGAAVSRLGGDATLVGGSFAQQVLLGSAHAFYNPGNLNGVDHDAVAVTLGVPQIVDIAVMICSTEVSAVGQHKAAVAVLQPQGINEHQAIAGAGAIQAVSHILNTGTVLQNHLTGLAGGDNLSTATDRHPGFLVNHNGGVDEALGQDSTVDVDLNILQVAVLTGIAAGGGGIGQSGQVLVFEHILAPVFHIPNIDIVAAGLVNGQIVGLIGTIATLSYDQSGALVHRDLHTGQQGQVLLDGGCTGDNVNGDIAIEGQNEGGGIHLGNALEHSTDSTFILGTGQIQRNAGHGGIAINGNVQAVSGRIVILDDIAALTGDEHTALTDEAHRQTHGLAAGGHGDVNILCGTFIQGQGHFDVLHIILGEGECLDIVVGGDAVTVGIEGGIGIHKLGHVGTTGEVGDLHDLIDLGAGVGNNITVAVNITPGKQVSAVIQGNGGLRVHVDGTVGTAGTAAGGLITLERGVLGLHIQRTIDSQLCAVGHGQGQEGVGSRLLDGILRSHDEVGIIGAGGRIIGIHRNQQGNSGGHGIITGRQNTALHQGDLALAAGLGMRHSLIQIGVIICVGLFLVLIADHEHSDILRHDHSLHRVGFLEGAGVGQVGAQIGIGGHIVPAHQLVALTGVGGHGISHAGQIGGSLGNSTGCHCQALAAVRNGVAAIGRSLEGGGDRIVAGAGQDQIGNGNGSLIILTAAGLSAEHYDLDGLAGLQLLLKGAAGGRSAIDGNSAAILGGNSVVKRQVGFAALIVGDGQGGFRLHIDGAPVKTLQDAVDGIAAGSPRGNVAIRLVQSGIGQADSAVGQTGNIYSVNRVVHNGQQTNDHDQCQHQSCNTLHGKFHSLHPFMDYWGTRGSLS